MKIVEYAIEDLHNDPSLFEALVKLFQFKGMNNKCRAVIESGTYLGKGTTRIIIDAILYVAPNKFPRFYTIEASEKNHFQAKENLKEFDWVEVIHGTSVDVEGAIDFVKYDDAIKNHEKYPDIFIDDLKDPVAFYTKEVEGQLFGEGAVGENNVFSRVLPEVANMVPLIVLDGAGGIGSFEFEQMMHALKGKKYYVLMDDIGHLKHFRSYKYVKKAIGWNILAESDRWALACSKQ